jgi:hypothetical protein
MTVGTHFPTVITVSSDFSIWAVSGFPSPCRRLVAAVIQCLQTEKVVARGLSLILGGLAIGDWGPGRTYTQYGP